MDRCLYAVTRAGSRFARGHDPGAELEFSRRNLHPVSHKGDPLGRAILNIDNRAVAEARGSRKSSAVRNCFEITGQAVHAIYSLPKILWLKRNRPDLWKRNPTFLSVPAYLLSRMGHAAVHRLFARRTVSGIRHQRVRMVSGNSGRR